MFRQVALLKKRTKGLPDGALEGDVNQAENAPESSTQSPSKDPGDELKATEGREIRLIYFVLSGHQVGQQRKQSCFNVFNCCIIFSDQERATVIQLNFWRLCRRESSDRKTSCRSAKK